MRHVYALLFLFIGLGFLGATFFCPAVTGWPAFGCLVIAVVFLVYFEQMITHAFRHTKDKDASDA